MTDQSAVEAANDSLSRAFETGDMDLMSAAWDPADDVVCIHPGWPMLRGRDRVLRSWALIMANTSYIQFFITDFSCAMNGDIAVVTCTENILTGMPAGPDDAIPAARVAATNVFRRRNGQWFLYVHHGSPVLESALLEEPE